MSTATNHKEQQEICNGCGFCNLGTGPIPPVVWQIVERMISVNKLTVNEISSITGVSQRSIAYKKKESHVN